MTARVQLYTRASCHLCDEAKAALERVRARAQFDLEVIDVDTRTDLAQTYGLEVPVIVVDGKKAAKFRVDEDALVRRLQGA